MPIVNKHYIYWVAEIMTINWEEFVVFGIHQGKFSGFWQEYLPLVVASSGLPGKAMGEVRHAMSVQVVRSQSLYLLERLFQISPGAQAAGDERKLVQRHEEVQKDKPKLTTLHTETVVCAELAVRSSLKTLNSEF